jgi:hypothetical protein
MAFIGQKLAYPFNWYGIKTPIYHPLNRPGFSGGVDFLNYSCLGNWLA